MYNLNHLFVYLLIIILTVCPVLTIFYYKKLIDKIAIIIWLYFFCGWMVELTEATSLIIFNRPHNIGDYLGIFPGFFYTISLYEIVLKKGIKQSIIYSMVFTLILIIVSVLDSKSHSNIISEFIYNLHNVIICILFIVDSIKIENTNLKNETSRLTNIFIYTTLFNNGSLLFLNFGWEFLYADGLKSIYINVYNCSFFLIGLVHYLIITYVLFQVAKRNNAGKITFGANADE